MFKDTIFWGPARIHGNLLVKSMWYLQRDDAKMKLKGKWKS